VRTEHLTEHKIFLPFFILINLFVLRFYEVRCFVVFYLLKVMYLFLYDTEHRY